MNGIARQLKTKKLMEFKSFKESMWDDKIGTNEMKMDPNLSIADFEKMMNSILSHVSYEALD